MRHALYAGILVSLICAVAGTFVVLRGLAFVGDALAHGVLPGIATALILGISGVIGAMVGAAVMMGGVHLVTRKLRLSGDTSVGLLFVGMLALGVGDHIGNLASPFWYQVVGGIARVNFREFFGYGLIFAAVWFVLGIFVFTFLPC